MNKNKIIRTICYFTKNPTEKTLKLLDRLCQPLLSRSYQIQEKRICSPNIDLIKKLDASFTDGYHCFALGTLEKERLLKYLPILSKTKDVSFNVDLTDKEIALEDVEVLFKIIKRNSKKTFNFTYVFNNRPGTPFFPSASSEKEGFSIGLQPTDLSEKCTALDQWLEKMKSAWDEIFNIYKQDHRFFGIDSSTAPLYTGKSSLVNFIKRLGDDFSNSITTDLYVRITDFLSKKNPKPIGLCGLMLPCLEDFDLADEYEKGNFSIERNLYLSLNSGLGIDTYPMGIDENRERVREILSLVRHLSNKYQKPLSVRLVSDGKTKIGEKTDFKNQFLKDVVIRPL